MINYPSTATKTTLSIRRRRGLNEIVIIFLNGNSKYGDP